MFVLVFDLGWAQYTFSYNSVYDLYSLVMCQLVTRNEARALVASLIIMILIISYMSTKQCVQLCTLHVNCEPTVLVSCNLFN
jgi:hypothetical protein